MVTRCRHIIIDHQKLCCLQACVDLPAVDCEPASMAECYKGAATCADYFWTLCFDRWEASS